MSWKRLYIGLIYSILCHVVVFLLLSFYQPPRHLPSPRPLEVTVIQEEPPPAKKAEEEIDERKQVVDQNDAPLNREKPESADYLGKHDQRVSRQTKAPAVGKFSNRSGGKTARPSAPTPKPEPTAKTEEKPKTKSPQGITLQDLKPKFDWNQYAPNESDTPAASAEIPDLPKNDRGLAQTDDHLEGVEIGVETALNTREFLYHSYYSRIKEKVRSHWEPKIKAKVERLRRFGRDPSSIPADKVTKVIVILDATGALRQIEVIGPSGESELDNAAIEAFKAAAPFPNPPAGMIDKDGTIVLHWHFILEA